MGGLWFVNSPRASGDRATMMNVLVANRGEVAIRVMRAAAELGIRATAVFSEDDDRSLHIRQADAARPLRGVGARAYLDAEQILALATEEGCDVIHPGYGFLSENAAFARRCAESGVVFVGPRPETLELCGDKGQARALAERCGVPILPGTSGPTRLDEARKFFAALGGGAARRWEAPSSPSRRSWMAAASCTPHRRKSRLTRFGRK